MDYVYEAASGLPESSKILLIHTLAGLKPVSEFPGFVNEELKQLLEERGFKVNVEMSVRYFCSPPGKGTVSRLEYPVYNTWIWHEEKVSKTMEEIGLDSSNVRKDSFKGLDPESEGKLFGYHKEEIDYYTSLNEKIIEDVAQGLIRDVQLICKWAEKSRSQDIIEIIREDANYLSSDYVLSPPNYSPELGRLIDARAYSVKMIDDKLFKSGVYQNLTKVLKTSTYPSISKSLSTKKLKGAMEFAGELLNRISEIKAGIGL